jgi:O-antigen ligase
MERRIQILTRAQLWVLMVFTLAGQFSISITHICGFLGGGLWLYKARLTRSRQALRWPLWVPFAAFSLASILAVLTALDPLRSFEHLKRLFEMGIFFWLLNTLADPDLRNSLQAFIDKFRQTRPAQLFKATRRAVTSVSPRNFFIGLILLTSSLSALTGLGQVMLNGLSIHHRISGTLSHYMTYSGILMQTALVAAAYLLFRNKKNVWAWGSLVLILLALAFSLTRQAWLGFGSGLLILLIFRKPVWIALLPFIAALFFWVSPAPIKERVESLVNLNDATLQERLSMWRLGWEIYKDYPVTGCGFHCLRVVSADYPEYEEILMKFRTVHNNLLQLAVDTGIIGVLAWLFLWLSYFVAAGRQLKSGDDPEHRWVGVASLGAVTAFLTGGIFETNFYDSEVVMMTYYLMALPFVYNKSMMPSVAAHNPERP